MIVYNGMTSYIAIPDWALLVVIQLLTIVVEASILLGYWYLRDGKLRYFEFGLMIVIANIATALLGIAIYDWAAPKLFDGVYYFWGENPVSALILPLIVSFVITGIIMLIRAGRENKNTIDANCKNLKEKSSE